MSEENAEKFFASAIKYNLGNTSTVVARGSGALAKQIETTARQNNIPVLQDFALSRQLSSIPLGEEIPETLYFAIAKLFEYILDLEEQISEE